MDTAPNSSQVSGGSSQQQPSGWRNFFTKAVQVGAQVLNQVVASPKILDLIKNEPRIEANTTIKQAVSCSELCAGIYNYGTVSVKKYLEERGATLLHLVLQEESGLFHISCCICVVHSEKVIYIVFRGSDSFRDWIVNFSALPTQFHGSINFHKGVYSTLVPYYEKELLPMIIGALEKFPGYSLRVTGHSLGGAYATMLFILLSIDRAERQTVQCNSISVFTFAAPCIVVSSLQEEEFHREMSYVDTSQMHSFVLENDIVPRLLGGEFHGTTYQSLVTVMGLSPEFEVDKTKYYRPIGDYYFIRFLDGPPGTANREVEIIDCYNIKKQILELPVVFSPSVPHLRKCVSDHSMVLYKEALLGFLYQ